ncbi:MAG: RloB family protein [Phycisphaerae bacterium]
MKQNRYLFSRPSNIRNPLPVLVVVCDDTKTAFAYFTELKHEIKSLVTREVVKAPHHGAMPDDVVSMAIERLKSMGDEGSERNSDSRSAVWAIIDLEADPERQTQARNTKERAMSAGVQVALSNPCFEVWTLAHLIDTGEAFRDCQAVVQRIKAQWKCQFGTEFGNKKAQADYSKILPLRNQAVERCRRRCPHDPSYTEVYKVVLCIQALCNGEMI